MSNNVIYTIQKKKMLPEEFVEIYKRAGENEKNFAWKTAAVLYSTVNHESFSEAFSNLEEYANAIGVNKSTVSRKVRAVEARLMLFNEYGDKYMNLSLECVTELLPLVKDENLFNFLEEFTITDTNRDKIREMVKEYRDSLKVEESRENEDGEESRENEDGEESRENEDGESVKEIRKIVLNIYDVELDADRIEVIDKVQIASLINTLKSFGILE